MITYSQDYTLDGSLDAGKVGRFVRFTGDGQVGLAVAPGCEVGVLTNVYGDGTGCVTHSGTATAIAGATLVAGDRITSDGQGRAIPGGTFGYVTTGAALGAQASVTLMPVPQRDSIKIDTPTASDGKMFVIPNIFPQGVTLYLAGAGDDSVSGRGAGNQFMIQSDTAGDSTVEWYFKDVVSMAGGSITWEGGQAGDYASMEGYAPATAVTPNGGGTGNCNVVNGLIVPAAGNGAYDVNLANAVPLPAVNEEGVKSGYWDYTDPWIGAGTFTPAATPGQGTVNLVAAQILLARFVNKLQLLGSHNTNLVIPAIKPKFFWPQWKLKVTCHNSGHAGLKIAWLLTTARWVTV